MALHDSFPCESASDQQQQGGISPSTEKDSSPSPPAIGISGNNYIHGNDTGCEINRLGIRGGGIEQARSITNDVASILLNDEMLDQFVEDLINAETSDELRERDNEADCKELDDDAIVDGKAGDIDRLATPTKSDLAASTIPAVIQWIRTRMLSIFQSILAMFRKLQQLCMIQQRKFDADPRVWMRLKQRNNITSDRSCANQQLPKHSKSNFPQSTIESHNSTPMQSRFSFQFSMKNNASTSTEHGRATSNRLTAQHRSLSPTKLSSGTTQLRLIENRTSRPRIDISQLQTRLMQRKSSSILISAENKSIKAPPMQLLNKAKQRLEKGSDFE